MVVVMVVVMMVVLRLAREEVEQEGRLMALDEERESVGQCDGAGADH